MKQNLTSNIIALTTIVIFGLVAIFCSNQLFETHERVGQERYIQELRFQNIDAYLDTTHQR